MEEVVSSAQQLYDQGLNRAEMFLSFLRASGSRDIYASSTLESAEGHFVRFQEALIDHDVSSTMRAVALQLEEELQNKGINRIGLVVSGGDACGVKESGLRTTSGRDIDYVLLYTSQYPLPEPAFVKLEAEIEKLAIKYQQNHRLSETRTCSRINAFNMHFPNLTSEQALRELEYLDRDTPLYITNGRPVSQGLRFINLFRLSEPRQINEENRNVVIEALHSLSQTDFKKWKHVVTLLKAEWRKIVSPLKIKYLFGNGFSEIPSQQREQLEAIFGKEQTEAIYQLIDEATDLVAKPFEDLLDATGQIAA